MRWTLMALALSLILLAAEMDGSDLVRLHVHQERTRSGVYQQVLTVLVYPSPEDRSLNVTATSEDRFRASSVQMYGVESDRVYHFTWRLTTGAYMIEAYTSKANGDHSGIDREGLFVP